MSIEKILTEKEKEYYVQSTFELGWTRNVLKLQIKAKAYEQYLRQIISSTNSVKMLFKKVL